MMAQALIILDEPIVYLTDGEAPSKFKKNPDNFLKDNWASSKESPPKK